MIRMDIQSSRLHRPGRAAPSSRLTFLTSLATQPLVNLKKTGLLAVINKDLSPAQEPYNHLHVYTSPDNCQEQIPRLMQVEKFKSIFMRKERPVCLKPPQSIQKRVVSLPGAGRVSIELSKSAFIRGYWADPDHPAAAVPPACCSATPSASPHASSPPPPSPAPAFSPPRWVCCRPPADRSRGPGSR